ncbi:MAG TPA: hypothetical protein V6D22_21480 [Candidatus Obscuribacterales bacterium]
MKGPFRLVIALVAVAVSPLIALAMPPSYSLGVQAYNAHQYKQALSYFSNAERGVPTSPEVHYYLGLCYQSLNQMSLARQQYQWVVQQADNPTLRGEATAALQQITRYVASSPTQHSELPKQATLPSGPKLNGRLQVMEFYADW